MKKSIAIVAGLLGGLGLATSADAAPPSKAKAAPAKVAPAKAKAAPSKGPAKAKGPVEWVDVETLSFDHELPRDWIHLKTVRRDFTNPFTGTWRYASRSLRRQLSIRLSTRRPGGIKAALQRGMKHMSRRIANLKLIETHDMPTGPNGGKAIMAVLKGVTAVYSPTQKKAVGREVIIVRVIKHSGKHDFQMALTYTFTHHQAEKIMEFAVKHLESFEPRDPIEVAKVVAEAAAKDKRPVTNPLPASLSALKQLQKANAAKVEAERKAAAK